MRAHAHARAHAGGTEREHDILIQVLVGISVHDVESPLHVVELYEQNESEPPDTVMAVPKVHTPETEYCGPSVTVLQPESEYVVNE